ncbi:MAG TPA: FAD-dependent oxidoreductase [Geminicoccus sp.]|jgi:D-amino-acid dehydrogenase|uniref:FAD-dependent oxidoreductase n=1 Tax=Geminicoccus sp. TaxID=2024832 RepID=UPI002E30635E|nr:FAD-dependent oxidoreductase [Geminicoccus sp.]HEX2524783.1 FAD-dependent oxidoreductase [Geminicoccus sp.]
MAATIVVGAGIVGTTTALRLAREGLEVTVVERQLEAGLETSSANGGMLAVNSAVPWSSPGTPQLLFKWLGKEEAPLLLRRRAIPGMSRWGLRFLANCRHGKYRQTSAALTRLAQKSMEEMNGLLDQGLVKAEVWPGGFLDLFKGARARDDAEAYAIFLEELGAEVERLDAAGCVALEPSLAPVEPTIGAGLWLKKECWGDARQFSCAAADAAKRAGARFLHGRTIDRIEIDRAKVVAVHLGEERIAASHVVVCAGPFSTTLMKSCGIRLPVAPVKGYSITLRKQDIGFLPQRPIADEFEHIVATPLGDRLRVAGTVEFDGYDRTIRPSRIANLQKGLQRLYPDLVMPEQINAWCGLRPMSADGLPVIDATPIQGLYLNTGHGALGWTLACGSAELIAGIVTGRKSGDAVPFRLQRNLW